MEDVKKHLGECLHRLHSLPTFGISVMPKSEISSIRARISEARRRREESAIAEVYQKHRSDGKGIGRQQFFDALLEIRSDLTTDETEADKIFDSMDMNEDGLLDFTEFRRAVGSHSLFEQFITQTIPFAEIVSSAIPESKETGQLNVFLSMTEKQIAIITEAVCMELRSAIAEKFSRIKMNYQAARSKQESNSSISTATKFSVDIMSAGDITSYHKGLSDRVGKPISFERRCILVSC